MGGATLVPPAQAIQIEHCGTFQHVATVLVAPQVTLTSDTILTFKHDLRRQKTCVIDYLHHFVMLLLVVACS